MVIECSACSTRFKLADEKIKAGGVKVRCSKCKEVFTVLPPESEPETDTAPAAADPGQAAADWSDVDSAAGDDSGDAGGSALDDVDWSDLNDDSAGAPSPDADDTPGFADSLADNVSADDAEDDSAGDSFSFGDDSPAAESGGDITADSFSLDDSGDTDDDDLDLGDSVGEGVQDEFSFDEESSDDSLQVDGASSDDFEWGDSSEAESAADDFDFDDSSSADSGDLDFSSISFDEQEEASESIAVEAPPAPAPQPAPIPVPEPMPAAMADEPPPTGIKGPQKAAEGRRGKASRRKKKKRGGLRGIMVFLLFIILIAGGYAGLLYWKKLWNGDPNDLLTLDYVGVSKQLVAELIGQPVETGPIGEIAVATIGGRFVTNSSSGQLFIVEGEVRNDFNEARTAIAVRGILFNSAGKSVRDRKVFCGNIMTDEELQGMKLDEIREREMNQFGNSLSNLDVAPGATLPYMIVFANLPGDIAEYNVVAAESSPGAKE